MALVKYFPLRFVIMKINMYKEIYTYQLCGNKRIFQFLYFHILFTFWKYYDHDPDRDHDFHHLFVHLKSLSFISSELVAHLILVFCNSIMLTILNYPVDTRRRFNVYKTSIPRRWLRMSNG